VAAVLVHIDLDGDRPHESSSQALAAGRAVASSWGATLYAAVIVHEAAHHPDDPAAVGVAAARVPGDAKTIEAVRSALARGGADKIVVAKTSAPIIPLWAALGAAWQGVLEHLRPRLVVFGADAPSAAELGPRTAARIGARLMLRARARGNEDVELRDRDRSYVRVNDTGAAVVLIGAASRVEVHGDEDIDVMVLVPPGGADPRVELAGTAPAAPVHTLGTLVAIGDDAAGDPEIVKATQRLARVLGAQVVGGAFAASAGVIEAGAVIERGAALAPEMCVTIGHPSIDLAGAASKITIGASDRAAGGALPAGVAASLGDLARMLEDR
jgi:hypothetical protein